MYEKSLGFWGETPPLKATQTARMTEVIDLATLLQTEEGRNILLAGGSAFGINVFSIASKTINFVDYGVTTLEDWSSEFAIPMGYEVLQDRDTSVMDQIVTVAHQAFDRVPVIISDFKVLPRDAVGRPHFTLFETGYDGEDDSPAVGKIISAGHSMQLKLRCTIPKNYGGFLGRWIVITFRKSQKISPTCLNHLEFVTGLRVAGNIEIYCRIPVHIFPTVFL